MDFALTWPSNELEQQLQDCPMSDTAPVLTCRELLALEG